MGLMGGHSMNRGGRPVEISLGMESSDAFDRS